MRKAKLIACLSLLPVVSTAGAILSSCSNSGTYTIMNLSDITYVNAAQNEENENVTLCNSVYIFKPDHTTAVIDADNSKCTIDGPKSSLISQAQIVKNAANNSISVLAKVSNWDGSTFVPGDLVLKLELKLQDGTPIECKTNIVLRHAYWIFPALPVWNITALPASLQLQLREGLNITPVTNVTGKIAYTPSGHENDLEFDTSTSGLLKYKAAAIPQSPYAIIVTATKDDYLVEKELWVGKIQ